MPTTLYLTVDLHAHRWFDSKAKDAGIWLCIPAAYLPPSLR